MRGMLAEREIVRSDRRRRHWPHRAAQAVAAGTVSRSPALFSELGSFSSGISIILDEG